jgi:hypothetical protein
VLCALFACAVAPALNAQAPAAGAAQPAAQPAAQAAAQPATSQPLTDMENLVGRVALYPDDLLSVVLPASTFPLQIVEADRWIQKNKGNKDAKPDEEWDDSIKAMINYPDVVAMMSNDLDWTSRLGEAVVADQTAVMDAVQSFRRKAEGAGNLMSDDKQTVVVEEDVVKIVQADPQVIYVPQYEPQVIVVQQPAPVPPIYYPTPYPCYWYPYPPGYSFAAGFFWGATVAWAFDWHGGGFHNDVNINVNRNTNINTGDRNNINNRPTDVNRAQSQQRKAEGRGSWQSGQSPSNVRQGRAPSASTGAAGTRPSTGAGAGAARPSTGAGAAQRPSTGGGASASNRAGTGGSLGGGTTPRTQPSTSASGNRYGNTSRSASSARSSTPSNDAFSGMSSGRSVSSQSSRGASSRSYGGGGFGGGGGGGGRGGGGRR